MDFIKTNYNRIKSNKFINASIFSAISTIVKVITTLLVGKIIVIETGAGGMATFGQFLNFVIIVQVLSGGALNEGVIKYVSEFKNLSNDNLKNLLSTATRYIFICSLFSGLILIFFSKSLSKLILYNQNYHSIFVLFGSTIFFYGFNNLCLAILSGFQEYKKFNSLNIFFNTFGLILTLILIHFYNIFGALVATIINQSIFLIFTCYFLRNEKWFTIKHFKNKFNNKSFKLVSGFIILSILTTSINPFVSIIIRNCIIDNLSFVSAGYYEFVLRISNTVIMFFSVTVSVYYLPRLSEIEIRKDLLEEVINTYKIVIPITIIALLTVFICKSLIINILANKDFMITENLFFYQLLGVFFRIFAQISGFVFLAKAKIKILLFSEILLNLFFVLISKYFIKNYGLIGCSYAFAIYNFVYAFAALILFKKVFFNSNIKN